MEISILGRVTNKYGTIIFNRATVENAINHGKRIAALQVESDIVKVVEQGDYDLFIDVGAAFGYYTRIASHFAETVIAFEPHPIRFGLLEWNTKDLNNIILKKEVVGTQPAFIEDNIGTLMGCFIPDSRNVQFKSRVISLDYLSRTPHWKENVLIKVDVEGNELDVIKSAGDIDATWIIELHRQFVTEEELFAMFPNHRKEKLGNRHFMFYK